MSGISKRSNKPDPTATLKSAVGVTMRAISEDKELEVAFTSDRPLLTKDKARLANLPRVPKKRRHCHRTWPRRRHGHAHRCA